MQTFMMVILSNQRLLEAAEKSQDACTEREIMQYILLVKVAILSLGLFVPLSAMAAPAEDNSPPEQVIIEGYVEGTFCGSGANEFREWSCIKVNGAEYSLKGLPPDPAEAEAVKTMKEGTPVLV